ncbi:hypothetical protein TG4357_03308 [Thalassovita gelatinovora]|uniref:Phage tail assembly chaperone-like domain-containing protein n=1 Tax=Thalassovita gelatinovora TaxID=53501 RepID=A0A0P1FIZ6_THAGE|nr:tail fiber assembly protein [Thalassovita gelatinovora]QIZ81554.1 hypothetical protein HFZ77_14235 [Thalassovita gelatinovora]CUH67961.1 hypothetical protein TG4357_03308 [Thalassovita gelatinovora]SEQ26355.1 Phage tail assembly chaperone protein [Thalassovita gelatinovora]
MHKFVIFDTKTGQITGRATGTVRSVACDLKPGQDVLRGVADPMLDRVEHGRIVPRGKAEQRGVERTAMARNARAGRDRLLAACDWTQLPDAQCDSSAWAAYRQALRDLTDQAGFPHQINWPAKPGRKESK